MQFPPLRVLFLFLQLHFSFSKVVDLCVVFIVRYWPCWYSEYCFIILFYLQCWKQWVGSLSSLKRWLFTFFSLFQYEFIDLNIFSVFHSIHWDYYPICNSNCPFFFFLPMGAFFMWILSLWQLFLLSNVTFYSRFILYRFFPRPGICHFFKKSWS